MERKPGKTPIAAVVLLSGYQIAAIATFIKLTFFDGFIYTWWNWIIAVPIGAALSELWPIYWIIIRPLSS